MTGKILLSTDIGSDPDDALSLLTMFNTGMDLGGIYTVNGDVNARACIAKRMVDLACKKIPVARGASRPLANTKEPHYFFEDVYVEIEFLDEELNISRDKFPYKPLSKFGIIPDGVKDFTEKLSAGKHIVFSLAPMTNIALAIQRKPEIVKNIERLYAMGFCLNDGELEHNIVHDPEAAQIVAESDTPLTIIPSELCRRYRMPVDMLDQLDSLTGDYMRKMTKGFLAAWLSMNFRSCLLNPSSAGIQTNLANVLHTLFKERYMELKMLEDSYSAVFFTEKYFETYRNLISYLKEDKRPFMGEIINALEDMEPKTLSIADVYVPYCFLHPERLKTEQTTISCNPDGKTYRIPDGKKHEIVTDLDFDHFQYFVKQNLR